ncbi:MAG: class I SAM-dependent methyltransferase [Bacteroidota bacterium]
MINRLYQMVRKITLKSKRNLVQRASGKKKGVMLDIGSGAGAFLATMKTAGWNVTGLEPDEGARQVAINDFGVEARPIEDFMGLEENAVDVITMWHVLEHVHELDAYMEKMHRLLKSDGTLLIAVPNYNSHDAKKYGEMWAAYDVPRHLYHFCATSMKALLERHGFKLQEMKRMPFDSYYVSMLSERYKKGNLVHAFWNGFCSYWVALLNKERCSSIIYVIKK